MASKKWQRQSMCGDKARYASYAEAETALRALLRSKAARPGDGRMQAYGCRFCRRVHVGHVAGTSALSHAGRRHPGR